MDSVVRKLKSSDGETFKVDKAVLEKSKILKELANDFPDEEADLPINEVDSKNLKKIIGFMEHYKNSNPKEIPKPLPTHDLKTILDDWDYNYINGLNLEELVDLVNGANYLDVTDLVKLVSAKIASEMLYGTVEEVRERFGIKSDMTEEELKEYNQFPLEEV